MEANQDDYTSIMADSRNMIIKGKRTKRPRPSSPLSLTMASTSSATTTTTSVTAASEDGDTENPNNNFHTKNGSIEFSKILQENEEEDMANCLILLAQSQSSPPSQTAEAVEMARTSGLYVYECQTCNRGFPSFQALGGHRASHKKPSKTNLEDKVRLNIAKQDVDNRHNSIELSLQIGSNQMAQCYPSGSTKVTKIHECSICGAEFGSGQALGGHMRRHRSMPLARTNCGDSSRCQESKKPKTIPSLDLNLPAPIEDDPGETKFPFRSKDQMIAFSNSSLVYCHI